jgi:hypothetical protein
MQPINQGENTMTTRPVFIHLLHGRDDPKQDMREWGFVGPILGPFEAVHFTYKEHIRCIADAETGAEIELGFHDDINPVRKHPAAPCGSGPAGRSGWRRPCQEKMNCH